MPFSGVLTATVLIAAVMTLAMGVYARLPFAVAPVMGLNAFFAFTVVMQHRVPWQVALGIVFWAGILFLILSATPLREMVAMAIPPSLRAARENSSKPGMSRQSPLPPAACRTPRIPKNKPTPWPPL
jgi:AGZA family xanthine/uracil permease-like MFS transporter